MGPALRKRSSFPTSVDSSCRISHVLTKRSSPSHQLPHTALLECHCCMHEIDPLRSHLRPVSRAAAHSEVIRK
ncbi:hypothetical protein CBOM_07722 [Ceraceosorus bombacis]|uniref:Uncharacterized protein n=1 Tax=Ceraceosorus bombacis TaxID=401625 RepID=A0A0P1BHJ5_9BASI|nr:hypothetical protein CBOM_07722 [Ceraceosorus bombacis]